MTVCGFSQEINVQGNSNNIADGETTPTNGKQTLFGSTNIANGTISKTYTIQNLATVSVLSVSNVTITGANPGDFSVTASPLSLVTALLSTTFTITFDPTAVGERNAIVTITSNDSNENPYTFSIRGTGTDPNINVQGNNNTILDGDTTPQTSDFTDFGSVNITSGTIAKQFKIQNLTTPFPTTLTIASITFTGTDAADFSAGSLTSVNSGSTGNCNITFNPTTAGVKNATVVITSNDSDESPYTFAIRATGTSPEANIQGNGNTIPDGDTVTTTADFTDLGITPISTPITKNFTIHNTGNENLTIGTFSFIGGNASEFTRQGTAPSTIAPGGNVTFTIRFLPTGGGLRTTTISIVTNDADENPYNFALSGTGAAPEINVTGNTNIADGDTSATAAKGTDFGTTDIFSGNATKTFTIENLGTATLNVTSASFSGTNASDFTINTTFPIAIAAGADATFTAIFNPAATGNKNATLNIYNNDSDEATYNFAVKGVGADPEINVQGNNNNIADGNTAISLTNYTDFGSTGINSGSITRLYKIQNLNTAGTTLLLGAITITGANASDFTISTPVGTSSVNINQYTTFEVTFNPTAVGVRNATITIANNDSNESAYDFAIKGTAVTANINIIGNTFTIADNDTTPSTTDFTNFGTTNVNAPISRTYTIQNTGSEPLALNGTPRVSISGTGASSYSVSVQPAATIAAGGSSTMQITFNPITIGTKTAVISITNDDPQTGKNPYTFSITGAGIQAFSDSDGDGVFDNVDSDDDNDGIPDSIEQNFANSSVIYNTVQKQLLNETFGVGTSRQRINVNVPTASTTYCYEDGTNAQAADECDSDYSLDDGQYTVSNTAQIASWASDYWYTGPDHTTDTNGRMALFNATNNVTDEFYRTEIQGVIANAPLTYSFWVLNLDRSNASGIGSRNRPNINVQFIDLNNNVIATLATGDIAPTNATTANGTWYNFVATFTPSVSGFSIVFKNNQPGGEGNDLALDDIVITQQLTDSDRDGIADVLDLDSDNDGIGGIVEAGFQALSNGKDRMDLTAGTWIDTNGNGWHDTAEAYYASNTTLDSDGDGVPNYLDLDSDNDSVFDIDEAGIYYGDGDVNGDGEGDGVDSDDDGILDFFDNLVGFGNSGRAVPKNTLGSGHCDYMKTISQTAGVTDISKTLYASLDANNDGKIDGSADIDKDGILDAFDTNTGFFGSPRNLTRKLFLDLDGRNDYAEGTQLLSGLAKSTIMGWIKLSSTYSASGFVMGQDIFNVKVNVTGGNKKLVATAKGQSITFAQNLVADRWYHVAVVYDGAASTEKLKLYVNGQKEITGNTGLSGNLGTSTARFTMGKNATTAADYFNGSIDEVRVFNTALSDDILQKMVYQEIKANGTLIRGEIIPKDIELSAWASVLAYYRMDNYKDDVIDNHVSTSIDAGSGSSFARIYNVKNIKYQLAPMPFVTEQSGTIDAAVSQDNFVNGTDARTYPWSIIQVKHNIDFNFNQTSLGMLINSGATVNMTNNNKMENTWYLKLDGKLDLQGRAQLVQTATSDLDPTSSGSLERDQQGQSNNFNYNYWCSPVGAINVSTNNNSYTVNGVLRDGTNPANPQNITWTTGLNGSPTSPITLSGYWIYKFQNTTPLLANWSTVGPNGTLMAGQGFTLKGSGAATPTQNLTFVGKPNNGNISIPIAPGNLNLSGNPYPSALDANAFITENLTSTNGTIYFWEHFATNPSHVLLDYQGGYSTYTMVGGTPPVSPAGISGLGTSTRVPGRFIPIGQAFLINGNSVGGNINFTNAQRAFIKEDNIQSNVMFRQSHDGPQAGEPFNNNDDVYEPDTYAKIRLGFNSANGFHRQMLLGFMDERAGAGFDVGYDAINIDTQPNDIYFMKGTRKQIIVGEGYFNENNVFPVSVKTSAEGIVQFVLDGAENFDAQQGIYIHDNVTNTDHDIRETPYELTLPGGTTDGRFILTFATDSQLGNTNFDANEALAVTFTNADNMITIANEQLNATVKSVALINMLGQMIATWNVTNENQTKIQIPVQNASTGTYVVKVQTTNGDISKKILIK